MKMDLHKDHFRTTIGWFKNSIRELTNNESQKECKSMKMTLKWLALALVLIYIIPSQSTMEFTYKCEGKDATATTYSYFKEPRLLETGYEKGLKSGSFNYLENGDMNIEENINLYYGNGTNKTNSSVVHELNVNFEGDRGISEFFGRGFFKNNRWISAWKKIRYEESPTMKIDGWNMVSRPSSFIKVDAAVRMDTSKNISYEFDYRADIGDGLIETKDATGWTNRSGSRKYDWEHEARTVGENISITNNLYDYEADIEPAGGPNEDWLPCCFKGTIPTIEQIDEDWPSAVVIATLQANTLLPNKKLPSEQILSADLESVRLIPSQFGYAAVMKKSIRIGRTGLIPNVKVAPIQSTLIRSELVQSAPAQSTTLQSMPSQVSQMALARKSLKIGSMATVPDAVIYFENGSLMEGRYNVTSILDSLPCEDGSCEGYDCVYTYDDPWNYTVAGGEVVRRGDRRDIDITLEVYEINASAKANFDVGKKENAKQDIYKIKVNNVGDVTLNNVIVSARLPIGMMFENTAYFEKDRGELKVDVYPLKFEETSETKLTWNIGTFAPREIKSILMEAYLKPQVDNQTVAVKVNGTAPDGSLVRDSRDKAEIRRDEPAEGSEEGLVAPDAPVPEVVMVPPDWGKSI